MTRTRGILLVAVLALILVFFRGGVTTEGRDLLPPETVLFLRIDAIPALREEWLSATCWKQEADGRMALRGVLSSVADSIASAVGEIHVLEVGDLLSRLNRVEFALVPGKPGSVEWAILAGLEAPDSIAASLREWGLRMKPADVEGMKACSIETPQWSCWLVEFPGSVLFTQSRSAALRAVRTFRNERPSLRGHGSFQDAVKRAPADAPLLFYADLREWERIGLASVESAPVRGQVAYRFLSLWSDPSQAIVQGRLARAFPAEAASESAWRFADAPAGVVALWRGPAGGLPLFGSGGAGTGLTGAEEAEAFRGEMLNLLVRHDGRLWRGALAAQAVEGGMESVLAMAAAKRGGRLSHRKIDGRHCLLMEPLPREGAASVLLGPAFALAHLEAGRILLAGSVEELEAILAAYAEGRAAPEWLAELFPEPEGMTLLAYAQPALCGIGGPFEFLRDDTILSLAARPDDEAGAVALTGGMAFHSPPVRNGWPWWEIMLAILLSPVLLVLALLLLFVAATVLLAIVYWWRARREGTVYQSVVPAPVEFSPALSQELGVPEAAGPEDVPGGPKGEKTT